MLTFVAFTGGIVFVLFLFTLRLCVLTGLGSGSGLCHGQFRTIPIRLRLTADVCLMVTGYQQPSSEIVGLLWMSCNVLCTVLIPLLLQRIFYQDI